MRFLAAVLLIAVIAAVFALARAPRGDELERMAADRDAAVERFQRLRGMTEEFIAKAYPDDPLLYCWARSTDCKAATIAWVAVVEDMRMQYREAVIRDDAALTPLVDAAEARLVAKVEEVRVLHETVPVADRIKTYHRSREAASEAFELYRMLPVEPRLQAMRAKTAGSLAALRDWIGL